MTTYRVTAPDGKVYKVTPPDGHEPTQEEILAKVQEQHAAQPAPKDYGLDLEYTGGLEGLIKGDKGTQLTGNSLAAGRFQNALQGATFNFADEVLPYVGAAIDPFTGRNPGMNFDERVQSYSDKTKEIQRRMWEERPWETGLSQVGGSLLSGGPLTRVATGTIAKFAPATGAALKAGTAGLGARTAQGVVAGAIGGGLAGAGAGEDLTSRIAGAGTGATLGAGIGGALPVVGSGLGATGRYLQSTFAPGTVNAENRAAGIMGEAVARGGYRPGQPGPGQQVANLQSQGFPQAALADTSDELTALTGAVARSPGEGRQIVGDFLRGRQEGNPALGQAGGGQWSDLLDDIAATVSPSVSAKRAGEAVIRDRATKAKPLYEKALGYGPVTSPELNEIALTPGIKSMLQRGVNMAKQRRELPLSFKLDPDGPIPVSVWHQAKQALDDAIGTQSRAGSKFAAGSLLDVQKRLLTALDDVTEGNYGIARQQFAGDSASLNALNLGKDIMKTTVSGEDIADSLAKFGSQSEQEFFRAGAAQALRDTVASVGRKGNAAAKFLNRPDMQMKMQAMFGNQKEYEAFVNRVMARDRMYRTYNESLGGSQTQGRIKTEDDLTDAITGGAEPTSMIGATMAGGRGGFVRAALGKLQDGSTRFLSEKVREQLARMLVSTDPQQVRRAAQLIQQAAAKAMEGQVKASSRRAGGLQGVLQPAFNAVGQPTRQEQ
jgi:hypothetical protein